MQRPSLLIDAFPWLTVRFGGRFILAFILVFLAPAPGAQAADAQTAAAALARIEAAGQVFVDRLSREGGYVLAASLDGSVRRGEGGEVAPDAIWIQPPGTAGMGAALLHLHEMTGDARWRAAADQTASVLVSTQLLSGGWFNFAELDPANRLRWCYRSRGIDGKACKAEAGNEYRNRSTLDDNISQGALGFLILYDQITDTAQPRVGDATRYAVDRILAAQYPNGAWPVNLESPRPPDQALYSAHARLPADWPRAWVKPEGRYYFVLNDNLMRNTVQVLLLADQTHPDPAIRAALAKAGDFLLAAQLPAPQRGWAQTYDADLVPVWGRRFEPPSVASSETASAIEALVLLYLSTQDARYLVSARDAGDWLRSVRLPSGLWARFYELGTDRALYIDKDDTPTYSDAALRDGYGFVGHFGIPRVLAQLDAIQQGEPPQIVPPWEWIADQTLWDPELPSSARDTEAAIKAIADAADPLSPFSADGLIQSQLFIDALTGHDRYVAALD